jgi:DNA (cytosine-5)-methyltransferase 1
LLFQLAPLALGIGEIESGLLLTPSTQDHKSDGPGAIRAWEDARAVGKRPAPTFQRLRNQVWFLPTMTVSQAEHLEQVKHIRMFPTPRASERKGVGPIGSKSHKHMLGKSYLCTVVQEQEQTSGQLSPVWVEWLMGYPEGWTALKDSEMPSSRKSPIKFSKRSRKLKT